MRYLNRSHSDIIERAAKRYLRAHQLGCYVGVSRNFIKDAWEVELYVHSSKEERRVWAIAPGLQKRLERTVIACSASRYDVVIKVNMWYTEI